MRIDVQRYTDRVSASFWGDADDVDCILTATLDLRVAGGLTDAEIIERARKELSAFTASEADVICALLKKAQEK